MPRTWYVDGFGGADFTAIQEAVTAAVAGDTIIVKDGNYTENVVVDKSLVILLATISRIRINKASELKMHLITRSLITHFQITKLVWK